MLPTKAKVLRGTFIEGRYLTEHGRHHENTFLYPGPGFNGIIPLFALPGLAIGLVSFVRRARLALYRPEEVTDRRERMFLLFIASLLFLLVAAMALGSDPKPTRYTFSILAVLILAAQGYEVLSRDIGRRIAGRLARARQGAGRATTPTPEEVPPARYVSWAAVCIVCAPVLLFAGMRLRKNHNDLKTYLTEYAHQVPTVTLEPALDEALSEAEDRDVAILYPAKPPKFFLCHPAVGLYLRYRPPRNIRLVHTFEDMDALPSTTKVIKPSPVLTKSLYWLPKRRWPDVGTGRDSTGSP